MSAKFKKVCYTSQVILMEVKHALIMPQPLVLGQGVSKRHSKLRTAASQVSVAENILRNLSSLTISRMDLLARQNGNMSYFFTPLSTFPPRLL